MNLKTSLTAFALAFGLSSITMGQTTRVAYVDIDRVTENSDKINAAMGNVENRVEGIQKDIAEKRKRLVDVKAEVKKGQGVLAESEMKKKRDEINQLEKELVDLEYEGRRELQKLDTTLFEPMIKTIVLAIQDVAREKKIDLVVRGEAVIYGADEADITEDVIKKLNSSAYNLNASKSESGDDESTGSSRNSENGESNTGASSDAESEKASDDSTSNKSIIPSIPLVTRPVDRQSD